ncbi:hypothetical protein M1D52_20640 [Olivibacter sp. SA151]|uniref:hypothetical protein n=1 Tax=Olivibacter jilunii TaxID=985016 RepID=UPI003F186AC2
MEKHHPIVAGTVGTTLMTLFSYMVAASKGEKFEEPALLAEMVEKLTKEKELARISGWTMHFAMGCSMAFVFQQIWKQTKTNPGIKQGLIAGVLSGLSGILIWKAVFKFHPNPPPIPFNRYYGHLLLAHVVFSMGVALTSRNYKNEKIQQSIGNEESK